MGLAGCNGMQHPEDFPVDGPKVTATSNPAEVSKDDFGHSWNLTVDHGTVACEQNSDSDPVLTFTAPDGTVYALNAVDQNKDLPDIGEISDGSIGTLRTFAFTVCDA
ncbi:superoxide dismutase [Micrococcus luteus]|uniref:Superoxide dismutase n=1 Tax=Brevibacterium luteolum TaxID=199591 RepID=A0A2N6PH44_9MICO|nr:superoxide dismutase [Brevibacterium luteolum]NNM50401.1 superoxide dismutase [Micrococcus luteus]PMB98001.1 superoxide dismutase [Brevibacterium luteolum]PMC74347.1 superoxide dismutase [Brachybacterium sp. UMB0905]